MNGYKTKADLVYDLLIEKIVKGELQAGEKLVISRISKENHVSDIPVREALKRLNSEGYIDIFVNQGAVVKDLSTESIREITQIKAVLEGYATKLCVDYITAEDISILKKMNDDMRQIILRGETQGYSQLNMEFHQYMYRAISHTQLYEMIMDLWKKHTITKTVFSVVPIRMQDSIDEHEELLNLIIEKKYDEVEMCVRTHKMEAGETLAHGMQKIKDN